MFAADRDLWIHEPLLFRDLAWSAQARLRTEGAVLDADGIHLAVPRADLTPVRPGMVTRLGLEAMAEVVAVDPGVLTLSRLRSTPADAPIPVVPGGWSGAAAIDTFDPQIGVVHRMLLGQLRIEDADALDAAQHEPIRRVETLGALHLVFAGAAAMGTLDDGLAVRARLYRERFDAARRRLRVSVPHAPEAAAGDGDSGDIEWHGGTARLARW